MMGLFTKLCALAFLAMLPTCLLVQARGVQDTGYQKVSLTQRDISLGQVFRLLEKQTGLIFFFSTEEVNVREKVNVTFKGTLNEALQQLLPPRKITWTYRERIVVLRKQKEETPNPALNKSSPVSDTTGAIISMTGKVTDAAGTPIPGATILVKGTTQGVSTDEDGNFTLPSVSKGQTLLISSIGYQAQEIKVSGNTLNARLALDVQNLDEVAVVSTGYQEIPKERATGSFVFVNNQLYNRRVAPDVLTKLEGIVPGLIFNRNVNATNNPNGVDINIQGHSTINSNDQPLIVVDNFPFDGNINDINPNDVESITILKDAAAASIWGVRSGNGVIVITTKNGRRNQKMAVEFNANLTIGEKPDLFYSPDFLDANSFIGIEQELFQQGFYDDQIGNPTQTVSPVVQILADQRAGLISAADASAKINTLRSNDYRNDLEKYFYQPSVNQQYQVNLRGGGNNSDYFFSAGYDRSKANQKGNSNDRVTLNLKNNFYPLKNLTISANLNFFQTSATTNSPISQIDPGGGKSLYPYADLVGVNGEALPVVKSYNYAWITDTSAQKGLLDWQYRPLDELRFADNSVKRTENRLNFGANYSFLNNFKIQALYQYEKATAKTENYYSDSTFFARNLINRFTNLTGTPQYPVPIGGILQQYLSELVSHRGRLQLNYSHNWKGLHEVVAQAGAEINQVVVEGRGNTAYGYDKNTGVYQNVNFVDYFPTLPLGAAQVPNTAAFSKTTDRLIFYYGNASYTYKEKYTATISGRIDKSNLFGVNTNQKSVPLYSVGAAWTINRERFYNLAWLPYLKLRTTFGYQGNLNNSVAAVTTIGTVNNNYYSGGIYSYIQRNGNPELRWERVQKLNFGIDFGLKNQTLTGSIDYFRKKGIDLFGTSPLAPSTGFTTFFGNTANTKGNGVDIAINSRNIQNGKIIWSTNFIFSYVQDIVTHYADTSVADNYIRSGNNNRGFMSVMYPLTGKPLFAIYAYPWAGLESNTGDPQGYIDGKPSTDWTSIITNTNIKDLNYIGPSRPTIFGSLRNSFSYKNLSLSFNLVYKLNYYFRRSSVNYNSLYSNWIGNNDYYNRWQKAGDEEFTNIPSQQYPPVDNNRQVFYSYSSALIEKGDHIRFQDASLSYDFNKASFNRLPFESALLSLYVNNIGIIWRANKKGLDPDIYTSYPLPRTYAIALKATF